MRPSTSATGTPPPESPAPTIPKPGAAPAKRQRKSAAPLGDVTNLLPLRPETPAPIKPRRTARRPVPAPSASSTCSSASVTPALKPPPSAFAAATPAPAPEPPSAFAAATPAPAPEPPSSAPVTPAPQPSSASASASATPAPQPPSASAPLTPAPQPSSCSAAPAPAPRPPSAASSTPAPEPSSTATATPAPKPSFAAVLEEEEEGRVFESPTICTVYARRRSTEVQAERRSNRTITNKGKEPAASCPPLGKSTRNSRKKDTRPVSSSAPCCEAKKKRPLAKAPKLPEEFVKKQKAYFADVDAFELAEEEVSESELE